MLGHIDRRFLLSLSNFSWFWIAIAALCSGLIASALYYQHVLQDYPCEICIYVRVWILAIALFALVALAVKKWRWPRALACLLVLLLALGLAFETWNLLVVEYAIGDGGSCDMFANFPAWAPLDKWAPAVFEVQGFCAATPEVFLGITMAQSLVLFCAFLISVLLVALFGAVSGVGNVEPQANAKTD